MGFILRTVRPIQGYTGPLGMETKKFALMAILGGSSRFTIIETTTCESDGDDSAGQLVLRPNLCSIIFTQFDAAA
ncbi:hypothetical protein OAL43_01550 [bacterium]|nr:hypothetical protein [bacterium]